MRLKILGTVSGVLLLAAGTGLLLDRVAQRRRFESLLGRTAVMELRTRAGGDHEVYPDAEILYYEVMGTEDRWIGGKKRALQARLRHLLSVLEARRRGEAIDGERTPERGSSPGMGGP